MSAVAVLVEHRQGAVRDVTFEMLAAGRQVAAGLGVELEAILLGNGGDDMVRSLSNEANRVIVVSHPALADYNYETYQRVLCPLLRARKPAVLLIANSAFGTDLAPSLAVELGLGLISDATGLAESAGGLTVNRGMYGGKLEAEILAASLPVVVMVRQSQFKPETAALAGEVVRLEPNPEFDVGLRTRFISLEELPSIGVDITKAQIVIGVGRGIKEEKNLAAVRELADAVGGVVAGSRPVVDAGWLPKECQVGSSGKTIKPKLYLALGISGAFQHVAGIKGADTVIAVNKDANAPIFAVAHYGIVDDLHKVVPALKAKLAEMRT